MIIPKRKKDERLNKWINRVAKRCEGCKADDFFKVLMTVGEVCYSQGVNDSIFVGGVINESNKTL